MEVRLIVLNRCEIRADYIRLYRIAASCKLLDSARNPNLDPRAADCGPGALRYSCTNRTGYRTRANNRTPVGLSSLAS